MEKQGYKAADAGIQSGFDVGSAMGACLGLWYVPIVGWWGLMCIWMFCSLVHVFLVRWWSSCTYVFWEMWVPLVVLGFLVVEHLSR